MSTHQEARFALPQCCIAYYILSVLLKYVFLEYREKYVWIDVIRIIKTVNAALYAIATLYNARNKTRTELSASSRGYLMCVNNARFGFAQCEFVYVCMCVSECVSCTACRSLSSS